MVPPDNKGFPTTSPTATFPDFREKFHPRFPKRPRLRSRGCPTISGQGDRGVSPFVWESSHFITGGFFHRVCGLGFKPQSKGPKEHNLTEVSLGSRKAEKAGKGGQWDETPPHVLGKPGSPLCGVADEKPPIVRRPQEPRKDAFAAAAKRKVKSIFPLIPYFKKLGRGLEIVPMIVGALGSWDPSNDRFLQRGGHLGGPPRHLNAYVCRIRSDGVGGIYIQTTGKQQYKKDCCPHSEVGC
ncbi:hypothetical protein TNIN_34111 [Trichonephila inaurata madagascariensis]|uniref:Uncharacterized protein n=1 Tax=Trichonephila inaurata madagascariensis TaxID=2747483 RepID=A0A8X6XQS5_9ARAC|nr:hypothetical protein TNIN_34111 [Trichonephila inaurata madagascariensis]